MRSSLVWDFKQHRSVVSYLRFGRTYRPIFKGHAVKEEFFFD